jgi:hypothetical protein
MNNNSNRNKIKKVIAMNILSFAKNFLNQQEKGEKHIRITVYVENVVAHYNSTEFQSHFRMTYETFEHLLSIMNPILIRHTSGPPNVSPEKQLLAVIWLLATPDSYR